MRDTSKYNTRGNRKLIAMVIVIFSILLILYTSTSAIAETAVWGVVSIGGAFMGTNIIKHGMDRFSGNNNNFNDEAEY